MRLNGWQRIGIVASTGLVSLVAATSVAEATCGERGGPGYRGPDRKCVGWEALGRVCGCPPSTRCTPEQTAPAAPEANGLFARAMFGGNALAKGVLKLLLGEFTQSSV